jgi:HlyD family secretion protein
MTEGRELVPYRPAPPPQVYVPPKPVSQLALNEVVRGPLRTGVILISVFVGGFGLWAGLVPLAGGAIAPGIISPDGSRRTVQHLEGGIIRKLHVRDGDVVERGQPLLELESVQPKANYDVLLKQQRSLRITRARLDAERLGEESVEFPNDLLTLGAETLTIIAAQRELFRARRASHEAKNRILRQRASQLREQIKGFEAQVESAGRQIQLVSEEVVGKRELANKGHLPKPELLRVLRMEAELEGRLGQYQAAISEAQQQIGEAELQLVANQTARDDQVATQLDQVQAELNAIEEKLLASKDVLNRTVVAAPVNGIIVNLKFKTESGVIQPGVPIMDIVPAEDRLLIDARISPMDIDVVRAGLKAQVQLSAISARSAPRIEGFVRSVSADRIVDEKTMQAFFLARIEVSREELDRVGTRIELVPGMPADVLIVTGERTMANYLLRPFLDAIWRTLRET